MAEPTSTAGGVGLAALAIALIERQRGLPSIDMLAPVAFSVGAIGDGWRNHCTLARANFHQCIGHYSRP